MLSGIKTTQKTNLLHRSPYMRSISIMLNTVEHGMIVYTKPAALRGAVLQKNTTCQEPAQQHATACARTPVMYNSKQANIHILIWKCQNSVRERHWPRICRTVRKRPSVLFRTDESCHHQSASHVSVHDNYCMSGPPCQRRQASPWHCPSATAWSSIIVAKYFVRCRS